MPDLMEFAKQELARIGDEEMSKRILAVLEWLDKQRLNRTDILALTRLLNGLPLTPLTGEQDEWTEVGNGLYQNNRCPAVFKEGENGRAYWLYGKIFSDDGGETWFTNNKSSVPIAFPFHVPLESERVMLAPSSQTAG